MKVNSHVQYVRVRKDLASAFNFAVGVLHFDMDVGSCQQVGRPTVVVIPSSVATGSQMPWWETPARLSGRRR
jgi:hypothetical protein